MKKQTWIILSILVIVGITSRVYNINFGNYGTEEEYTLAISNLSFLNIFIQSMGSDFNPPVYYFLSHISIIFGQSIRIPSMIAGTLLIPAMFILGKTYKDEWTGLYCAAFTTILIPFIYYSQYGRAYELSVLIFTVALVLYLKKSKWFWPVAAFCVWTHLFSIVPLAMLGIDLIVESKNLKGVIVSTLLISPLSFMFISLTHRTHDAFTYGASWIQMIVLTPLELFNALFLNFGILTVVGLYFDKRLWKILMISFITIAAGIIASLFTPVFPRYVMDVTVIFLLISAVACVNIGENVGRWKTILFILIIISFVLMTKDNIVSHYTISQY